MRYQRGTEIGVAVTTRPSDALHRVSVRVDDATYDRMVVAAEKRGQSVSDLLRDALVSYLDANVGFYDIPDILVQRINQLIDQQQVVMGIVETMSTSVNNNLRELVQLANGSNYLFDTDMDEVE